MLHAMIRDQGRHFTCSSCKEEFESTRTDEEALAESQLIWGKCEEDEETTTVCEACFLQIMAWHGKQIGRA